MWPMFEVSVQGFPPAPIQAPTRGKALADAWRNFTECYDCTFRDFIRIARVRRAPIPASDGYAYVRRAYGVDPVIGQRVTLRHEGPSSGRQGTVMYPGASTAHVRVLLDGDDHPVSVHPDNVALGTLPATMR